MHKDIVSVVATSSEQDAELDVTLVRAGVAGKHDIWVEAKSYTVQFDDQDDAVRWTAYLIRNAWSFTYTFVD